MSGHTPPEPPPEQGPWTPFDPQGGTIFEPEPENPSPGPGSIPMPPDYKEGNWGGAERKP